MERKNNETSGGDSSHFLHQSRKKKIYINNIFNRDVNQKLKSGPSYAQVAQKNKNLKQPQTAAEAQEREEELEGVFRAEEKLLQNDLRSRDPFHQGEEEEGWLKDEIDLLALEHKASEELYKVPRFGGIYEAVTVDVDRIEKRLKDLSSSMKDLEQITPMEVIVKGLEIADSVSLLKIHNNNNNNNGTSSSSTSNDIIEIAGQRAQRAATLMIRAQMMYYKSKQLLSRSLDLLEEEHAFAEISKRNTKDFAADIFNHH